jgi:hypothetical protein
MGLIQILKKDQKQNNNQLVLFNSAKKSCKNYKYSLSRWKRLSKVTHIC